MTTQIRKNLKKALPFLIPIIGLLSPFYLEAMWNNLSWVTEDRDKCAIMILLMIGTFIATAISSFQSWLD